MGRGGTPDWVWQAGSTLSPLETNQTTISLSLSHVLASLPTLKIEALPVHPVFSQR